MKPKLKITRCAGFPKAGDCEKLVDREISPLWCPECEMKRQAHIDKQFKDIAASFEAKEAGR